MTSSEVFDVVSRIVVCLAIGIRSQATGLVSFDGFAIGYDNDGNMVSKVENGGTQTFAWSSFGQLTFVTTNGSMTSFHYDTLGRGGHEKWIRRGRPFISMMAIIW